MLSNFLLETGIPPHILVPGPFYTPPPALRDLPVGIIGAGAAGLYTAMMLDSLCIKYEILEGSGRHGGRILTHEFTKELPGTPYQYFVSPISRRLYSLLNNATLGMRSDALSGCLPDEAYIRSRA